VVLWMVAAKPWFATMASMLKNENHLFDAQAIKKFA